MVLRQIQLLAALTVVVTSTLVVRKNPIPDSLTPHNRVFNARFSTGFRRFISPFHRRCPARPCALFQALSEACTRSSTGRQGRIVPLFLFIGGGQLKPKQRRFRSISISGFSSEPLRNGPISAVCERRKNRKSLIHRGASIFPSWR